MNTTLPKPMAVAKPAAKPLWQMDVRSKLDLSSAKTDPVSRLLFAALYSAQDQEEFEESVEAHVEDLQKALAIVRSGGQS